MQCRRLDGHCPAGKKSPELRRGASLFLPPAREDVSKLTGEGEGSKPWTKQVLAASFSLITPGVHTGELPPLGEAQTVDKVGLLSSRTSDRCHWCGDPHPKSLKNTAFLKKNGLPRQCAHWLAMTCFGVCLQSGGPLQNEDFAAVPIFAQKG